MNQLKQNSKIKPLIAVILFLIVAGPIFLYFSSTDKQDDPRPSSADYEEGVLRVHFAAGVTPEQAKEIAASYGGEIQEKKRVQKTYENGELVPKREYVEPWDSWYPDYSNSTSIFFEGADQEELFDLRDTLEADQNIDLAMLNYRAVTF